MNTATTEIYSLSLPDALPICGCAAAAGACAGWIRATRISAVARIHPADRKSIRLNSSPVAFSRLPSYFFNEYGDHRDLLSFPTRRSSDLWLRRSGRCVRRVDSCNSDFRCRTNPPCRSEEHTSELQSRGLLSSSVLFF